jgi:hypothetical protein
VSGNYFIGNGSQLTGIAGTYGNANVAAFMAAFGSNTITTTGNIVVGNVSGGNGNIDGRYYNLQGLTGNSSAYIGRRTNSGQGNRAVFAYTNGNTASSYNNHQLQFQPNQVNLYADYYDIGTGFDGYAEIDLVAGSGTNPFVLIYVAPSTTGVEKIWTYDVAGNLTLPGNTSAINYANGTSILSGIGTYGNANVVANLAALGSNPVSTTGNVTAGYFVGNGSLLTSLTGANVTGTVANATTATTAGTVTTAAQANITSVGTLTSLAVTGNASAGNITTVGLISATGNVSGNFFIGNGSLLTGISGGTYGNANVVANLAALGSNPVSTTGNVTAGTGIFGAVSVSGNVSGNSASNGVKVVNYKDNVYALTYAATITPDAANGSIQQVTLTGNVTWNAFGGTPQAGQSMVVSLTQDATGNRLLTSSMKFAGGSKVLSTAANSVDIISVFYDGTNYYASLTLAYS